MILKEMISEIEKEIEMAEYVDEDTCSNVSADLLRHVLVVLESFNPELEITT